MAMLKYGLLALVLIVGLAACNPKPDLLAELSDQVYPKSGEPNYKRNIKAETKALELSPASKRVLFTKKNQHVMNRVNSLFQKKIEGLIVTEGISGTLDTLEENNFLCNEYKQSLEPISSENLIICKVLYSNTLKYLFMLPWQEKKIVWPLEWTIFLLDTKSEQIRVKTFLQPMGALKIQELLKVPETKGTD